MADWTLISTTVGAAAVSGGFGYLAARAAGQVAMRQAEEESNRAIAQIGAENKRLVAQHREDHLRNRQGTYHAFLNAEREIQTRLAFGSSGITREEYDAWASDFLGLLNGVLLFGDDNVLEPAADLQYAWGEVFERFMKDTSSRPFAEKMADAYHAEIPKLVRVRQRCLEAMRESVAPR